MNEDRRLSVVFNWLVTRHYQMDIAKSYAKELIDAIDLVDPLRQQTTNSEPTDNSPGLIAAFALIADLAGRLSQPTVAEHALKLSRKIKSDRETGPVNTAIVNGLLRFFSLCWHEGSAEILSLVKQTGLVRQPSHNKGNYIHDSL